VSDKRARLLSNDARSALVDYCSVQSSHDNSKSSDIRFPLSPFMQRAYDEVLRPHFADLILTKQQMFAGAKGTEVLLSYLPADFEADKAFLKATWTPDGVDSGLTSEQKWTQLETRLSERGDKGITAARSVVFSLIYPRLDVNVSKHQNHLLKSPFCVHPGTGKVCVAFDGQKADQFDPFNEDMVHAGNVHCDIF
jgi:DNA primase small subunit